MSFITTTNLVQLFAVCSVLSRVVNADIIGVDLSDQSQDGRKPPDNSDLIGLLDPVMRLNRYTFDKTILEEHADEVPHWIVLFCPPWFEPCQALDPVFRGLTEKWQTRLNNGLLSTEVRFAAVDCATEKALCNSQNVVQYPFVAHYHNRVQVKVWRGKNYKTDQQRLTDFVQKELGPVASAVSTPVDSEDAAPESVQKIPVDFLLIFAAIAGNAWFISRGSIGSEAASRPTPCSKMPVEGAVGPPRPRAEHGASCVARSLPKEWGQERQSLEL